MFFQINLTVLNSGLRRLEFTLQVKLFFLHFICHLIMKNDLMEGLIKGRQIFLHKWYHYKGIYWSIKANKLCRTQVLTFFLVGVCMKVENLPWLYIRLEHFICMALTWGYGHISHGNCPNTYILLGSFPREI